MKKLNPKAFWPIICGIGAAAVWFIISTVISFTSDDTTNTLRELYAGIIPDDMIESIIKLARIFTVVVTGIILLIYIYFVSRLLKNRKTATAQGYITVLIVFNIIGLIFNIFSVRSNPLTIINILINVSIVAGCFMQKKYIEPPMREEDELLPPKDDIVFPGH